MYIRVTVDVQYLVYRHVGIPYSVSGTLYMYNLLLLSGDTCTGGVYGSMWKGVPGYLHIYFFSGIYHVNSRTT